MLMKISNRKKDLYRNVNKIFDDYKDFKIVFFNF